MLAQHERDETKKRHLLMYNRAFVERVHAERRKEEREKREKERRRIQRMKEAATPPKPKRRRIQVPKLPPMPLAECLRISAKLDDQDKIREVVERACQRFDVTAKEIQGLERRKAISDARDMIVLELFNMGVAPKNIATILRRDRSTVAYRLGKLRQQD